MENKDHFYISLFPLAAFKILLWLFFFQFLMCTGLGVFEFILLEVYWVSQICRLKLFIKFWKFLASIFSNILSVSSLSLSWTPIMLRLVYFMVSHLSLRLWSLFFIVSSFCYSDWIISIDLSESLLTFLLPSQICCSVLLMNVLF